MFDRMRIENLRELCLRAAEGRHTAADRAYAAVAFTSAEHVTLSGDWFVPVAADVCHIAERNYGWEDIESGVLAFACGGWHVKS
jgi:hypothetical protein